ncbi:MAG: hypothetical protein ACI4U5_04090, partial [Bacilli bacterium]
MEYKQEMVNKIDKLFHEEANFSLQKLGPLAIYKKRQSKEYEMIVNDIYDYLHSINAESGTPLSEAVNYFLKAPKKLK